MNAVTKAEGKVVDKKVLIVINSLYMGGAERQVVNDANQLSHLGCRVTVAYHYAGKLCEQLAPPVNHLMLKSGSSIPAGLELYRFLKRNKFDFIFAHMYWGLKVSGLAAFLTGHSLFFFEHGLGGWRKFFHLLVIRINELFVRKVIVVSSKKRNVKVAREKTPKKKIIVIPNSFRASEMQNTLPEESTNRKDGGVNILFMGRFNEVKQLHLLPEICRQLIRSGEQAFKFILCGSGREESNIRELIRKEGLESYFLLPGYVKNPYAYLKGSDIFVLPSRTEDFSIALLEAGNAGLPSVVFDVGGNSEIIKNGITGFLIPPFDTRRFASQLQELMHSPALRNKMGSAAKAYVENNFTEQHRERRLLDLIGAEGVLSK